MKSIALLVVVVLTSACMSTGTGTSIPAVAFDRELGLADLDRGDYVILDNVSGRARFEMTRWFMLINVPTNPPPPPHTDQTSLDYDGTRTALMTFPVMTSLDEAMDQARRRAEHEALMTAPGADAIIEPRYTWDWEYTHVFPFWWSGIATCTVFGKAIQLKQG